MKVITIFNNKKKESSWVNETKQWQFFTKNYLSKYNRTHMGKAKQYYNIIYIIYYNITDISS